MPGGSAAYDGRRPSGSRLAWAAAKKPAMGWKPASLFRANPLRGRFWLSRGRLALLRPFEYSSGFSVYPCPEQGGAGVY